MPDVNTGPADDDGPQHLVYSSQGGSEVVVYVYTDEQSGEPVVRIDTTATRIRVNLNGRMLRAAS